MKKIKLELESLIIESFETAAAAGERGTVEAHAPGSNERCNSDWSCVDTCYFMSCLDTQCYCNVVTYEHTCDDVSTCAFYC
jgi:hypothetical protein